jgi:hypothetical protein
VPQSRFDVVLKIPHDQLAHVLLARYHDITSMALWGPNLPEVSPVRAPGEIASP